MMRSLYSGISGLKNHQTRMDVIGNNIANVNTVGYKTSRVIFQDIFSQTVKSGTPNLDYIGGTNPMQIGLGIKLSSVDVLHTPAPIARTDNPFDVMIEGDGFFILQDENQNYYYARAGDFRLDDQGYLVSSHGYYVMGYTYPLSWEDEIPPQYTPEGNLVPGTGIPGHIIVDENGDGLSDGLERIQMKFEDSTLGISEDLVGFSVGQDGSVNAIINNIKEAVAYLGVAMFSNPGGLEKAGNSLYREGPASGEALHTLPYMDGAGKTLGGGLEMSNVDLATEFTDMIITQRGFQANSRVITVSDTLLEELVNLKR